jgi:hypothetical protein
MAIPYLKGASSPCIELQIHHHKAELCSFGCGEEQSALLISVPVSALHPFPSDVETWRRGMGVYLRKAIRVIEDLVLHL